MQAAPSPGAWREFRDDLAAALRVWSKAPLLPVLSILIALVSAGGYEVQRSNESLFWIVLLTAVFTGWPGAERIWYLRLFRDKAFTIPEALKTTVAFFRPFLSLALWIGLISLIPLIPLGIVAYLLSVPIWGFFVVGIVLIDVFATFMTPALSFTTRKAGDAFDIGFKMLRAEWPRCAFYALVPPLALVLLIQLTPSSAVAAPIRIALAVPAALLNLWFKGATAAFYLRRHSEVGDYGSLPEPQEAVVSSPR